MSYKLKDPIADLRASLDRQVAFTEIMCAGMEERKFDESQVKRAGGKFATKEEKAKMAEDAANANAAAVAAAPPGVVELPDGSKSYKMSPKEESLVADQSRAVANAGASAAQTAKTDPIKGVDDLAKATVAPPLPKGKAIAPEAQAAFAEKTAPVKAKAAAQVAKAVADNMSDDQVKKGLVTVTKQLNSGKPSKPEEIMQMLKEWAAQAQSNIGNGIKQVKSAGSEGKAKALAAGTGLMTKISEMAVAAGTSVGANVGKGVDAARGLADGGIKTAQNAIDGASRKIDEAKKGAADLASGAAKNITSAKDNALKTLGDAASSAGKAIGDKVNEAGFSTNLKDLPGDVGQIGKDLGKDASETADRAKKAVGSNLAKLGDEANKLKAKAGAELDKDKAAVGASIGSGIDKAKGAVQNAAKSIDAAKNAAGSNLAKLGDEANKLKDKASKAVGDKVNEAGFSADLKDLPGDLKQVGKDLATDAKEAGSRAKNAAGSNLAKLGDAANSLKNKASAELDKDKAAVGKAVASGVAVTKGSIEGGVKNVKSAATATGDALKDPNFLAKAAVTTGLGVARVAENAARKKAGLRPRSFANQLVTDMVAGKAARSAVDLAVPSNRTTAASQSPENLPDNKVIAKPSPMKALGDAATDAKKKAEVAA